MLKGKFSDRVENLYPSSIRKIMGIARRLISEGRTVYELNIGQPDIPCIPSFTEAIAIRGMERQLKYSPYAGEAYLRETFARYLNNHFDRKGAQHLVVEAENVHVTVGASLGLTSTFLALCNPGDEILCFEPFFSPYFGFLSVAGGVLKTVPTHAEKDFSLPPSEEIEKCITPRTKGILFNSPCNPTGKIFTKEEVLRLAKIAIKHDIFLISDEVYREMVFEETECSSLLEVQLNEAEMETFKHRIIVIDSASKAFSLCGARVGFVVSRPEVLEKISLVTAHTVACVSDILQYGVAVAYDSVLSSSSFFEDLRRTFGERLEVAMNAIKTFLPEVIAPRPQGSFYLMLQFPEMDDISDYCFFMLEKFNLANETVAITPAGCFYLTPGRGKNEIRMALVVDSEKIKRCIIIMAEAYKAYKRHLDLLKRPSLSPRSNSPDHLPRFRNIA